MDGAERTLLLRHLAASHPDVVWAGIRGVAEQRAEAAERRRVAHNRKGKGRHRRRRGEPDATG